MLKTLKENQGSVEKIVEENERKIAVDVTNSGIWECESGEEHRNTEEKEAKVLHGQQRLGGKS